MDELPKSKRHYHLILIKEMLQVMSHLNSSPPRKYTFDEWAWYLKWIGEDESEATTHRKALRKPRPDGEGLGAAMPVSGKGGKDEGEEGEKLKWSWVGNRSPLMGEKEEAEWVLDRLTNTLERELEAIRREELEMKSETVRKEGGGEREGERSESSGTLLEENKK
jgi:potassium channel subfamily K